MNAKHLWVLLLPVAGFAAPLYAQEPPLRTGFDSALPFMPYDRDAIFTDDLRATVIGIDGAGNQYIHLRPHFRSGVIIDLDPGPGEVWVDPSAFDVFVVKYDKDNIFQWVKKWSNSTRTPPISFQVDTLGNIYIQIIYKDNVLDLDPGPAFVYTTPDHIYHYVKLNTDGEYQWHFSYENLNIQSPCLGRATFGMTSIAVNDKGSFLLFGRFFGTIDIDPHPDREALITSHLCTSVEDDISSFYLCNFDTNGNLKWHRTTIGNGPLRVFSIAEYDDQGNLYVAGDWDSPGGVQSELEWYEIISKISPTGNTIWATNPIPIEGFELATTRTATLDRRNNLIVSITTTRTDILAALPSIDLDPGDGTAYVQDDGFLNGVTVKYGPNWTVQWTIPRGHDTLQVDSENSILGQVGDIQDADPEAGYYPMPSGNQNELFIKYNSKGTFLWAEKMLGLPQEHDPAPMTYYTDDIFSSEYDYALWIDLDPGPEEYLLRRTFYWEPGGWVPHRMDAVIRQRPVLMPEVNLDRDFVGAQHGTATNPYNNMPAVLSMLEQGGRIVMHASDSSETPTLSTPMTITSFGGPSRIGVVPPAPDNAGESNHADAGFVSRAETK